MNWSNINPVDGCGEIVALGSETSKHDTVMGICGNYKFGTFGLYSVFKWTDICLKPSQLSMEHAAALPMVLLTAWQCSHTFESHAANALVSSSYWPKITSKNKIVVV